MNVKKITFLKFNNVNMCIHDSQHMTFDEITQQFFQLQFEYLLINSKRFSIDSSKFASRLSFSQFELQIKMMKNVNLMYFRIKIKTFCFLFFNHRKESHVIEEQHDDFLFNIFEFVIVIQSIHDVVIKINAQSLLIKTKIIEIIKFAIDECIHHEML